MAAWDMVLRQFVCEREHEDEQWYGHAYESVVRSRMTRGDWCYLLLSGERVAGAIFASQGPCYIPAVRYTLHLGADCVGFYDVYMSPSYRGRGLYAALFAAAVNDSLKQGFQRLWMWIMPHNRISLEVHNRLGLRHVFLKITLRQRWGVCWHRIDRLDGSVQDLLAELSEGRGHNA